MKTTLAVIQNAPTQDVACNIAHITSMILEAASHKAEIIVLPELFYFRGDPRKYKLHSQYHDGALISYMQMLAKQLQIAIVCGSIIEKNKQNKLLYDTSVTVNARGIAVDVYRKQHLFEVQLANKYIKESSYFASGTKPKAFKLKNINVATQICFDIRFAETFDVLRKKGVSLFCIPSNFTYETGKAHWEPLLRSRAIETQSYIMAANCAGVDQHTRVKSYGNSMIIDPWGTILARASKHKEEIIYATYAQNRIKEIRTSLPMIG